MYQHFHVLSIETYVFNELPQFFKLRNETIHTAPLIRQLKLDAQTSSLFDQLSGLLHKQSPDNDLPARTCPPPPSQVFARSQAGSHLFSSSQPVLVTIDVSALWKYKIIERYKNIMCGKFRSIVV